MVNPDVGEVCERWTCQVPGKHHWLVVLSVKIVNEFDDWQKEKAKEVIYQKIVELIHKDFKVVWQSEQPRIDFGNKLVCFYVVFEIPEDVQEQYMSIGWLENA